MSDPLIVSKFNNETSSSSSSSSDMQAPSLERRRILNYVQAYCEAHRVQLKTAKIRRLCMKLVEVG